MDRVDDLLADPLLIDGWLAALVAGEADGHRDVAASYLASWLAGAIAVPVAAAVQLTRRAWPVTGGNLALHRHPDGWFDGVAVRGPRLRVLPDDIAGDPDAEVVDDIDGLRACVARELADVLSPVFAAIRERAPYGTSGMWGSVADGIAADALRRTHERRGTGPPPPGSAGWARNRGRGPPPGAKRTCSSTPSPATCHS